MSKIAGHGLFSLCDAADPFWFEPVAGANYGPWYTCTIKAVTDIKKGDEIVFRYFDAPKEWDE